MLSSSPRLKLCGQQKYFVLNCDQCALYVASFECGVGGVVLVTVYSDTLLPKGGLMGVASRIAGIVFGYGNALAAANASTTANNNSNNDNRER